LLGSLAPARAYINELLPDVLQGKIEPGCVFDMTLDLEDVPEGYVDMDQRRALKVLVKVWLKRRLSNIDHMDKRRA
jgi:threonine dehydrogenase-like Zn-dependent dehydrogenase